MVENERDEGVDVDALDRVLDKLTRSFGILTKSIDDLAKASKQGANSASVDHQQIHKNKMEQQAQAVANVEAMKRLAAELKGGGSQLKMFTGYLAKGVAAGAVFEKLTNHLGDYVDVNNNLRSAQEELILLVKKYGAIGDEKGQGKDKRWAKADPADRERAQQLQEQTKDKQGSKMLDQLSGAKEFFKKHKMGILIGAASAGVLIAILKKAFDSSPMFQSMLKLWHYGIMLVLRPIGDFFGFVMRPIMILLLRKFIIPWYTVMLPLMQTFGDQLGQLIIGVGGKLLKGDIAGAFALLFEGVDLTTKLGTILKDLIWGVLKAVIPVFAVSDIITGLFGIGNSEWFTKWSSAAVKWFKEGLASATANWDEMWTIIKTWFSLGVSVIDAVWGKFWDVISIWFAEGVAGVVAVWDDFWKSTYKWFDDGVVGIVAVWSKFWDDVYTWFSEGVDGVTTAWDDFWKSVKTWFEDGVKAVTFSTTQFWEDVHECGNLYGL